MNYIKNIFGNSIFQSILVSILLILIFHFFFATKVVYVRSEVLISGYTGTKESYALFENERKELESNIDTMKYEYQRQVENYTTAKEKLSNEQIKKSEAYLDNQRNNLIQYTDVINEKVKEKEKKLTQDLFNQINSFIEQYSKRKGYDIVIGTTNSGNLLYGVEGLDITDNLLVELNKNYKSN